MKFHDFVDDESESIRYLPPTSKRPIRHLEHKAIREIGKPAPDTSVATSSRSHWLGLQLPRDVHRALSEGRQLQWQLLVGELLLRSKPRAELPRQFHNLVANCVPMAVALRPKDHWQQSRVYLIFEDEEQAGQTFPRSPRELPRPFAKIYVLLRCRDSLTAREDGQLRAHIRGHRK